MITRRCIHLSRLVLLCLVAIATVACSKDQVGNEKLRIGWQIPLATQGQIVSVLKRTDILEQNDLTAEFYPFSFGSPQVEAAKSGSLDVIFVGDQPAINLIASGANWKILCVLFETRVAVMVEKNSQTSLEELDGKTVASPFGSVAHREAVLLQNELGLTDVKNVNVDILELAELARSASDWGKIDAIGVWEPTVSLLEDGNLAKTLFQTKTLGVVAVHESILLDPTIRAKLLTGIEQAWDYLRENTAEANTWYAESTNLGYTQEYLTRALRFDRNGDPSLERVRLELTDADMVALKRGVTWAWNEGYIPQQIEVSDIVWRDDK